MENQLKVTFFLSLAVGLTGGSFGNWQIPTIAVCAYAVIGWLITRNEENIERFADSLYYMGFLFTIWGLLFAFGPWIDNVQNLSSTTIITQFGIKLITTVVALTARIVLIQVRSTLAEETEESRETLGAMAKAMIREMEQSVEELQNTRNRILARTQEDASQMQAAAMRDLATLHAEIHQQSQQMLAGCAGSLSKLLGQIEAIRVPPDILATPLDAAAKDLAAETAQLQAALRESGAGIAAVLADSLERAQESGRRMDSALAGFEGFGQLVSETDAAVAAMAKASATLQETFRQTNTFLGELTRVIAALQQATNSDVTNVREALKTAADDIQKLRDTLRSDAESYSAALTDGIRVLRREIERQ
jgi:hypothetical protein